MTGFLFIVYSALAIPALAASLLSQVELWQRKEYRLDRLLAALSGPELRARLQPYLLAALAALFGAPLLSILILFLYHAWRIFRRGLARPSLTAKAKILLSFTGLLTALIALPGLITASSPAAAWATVILLVPALSAVAVAATNAAAGFKKRQIIQRAASLRSAITDLTVVGITGSFGKTSTKHFLAQLLPAARATKEHRNSEFPVAQDMLEQLPHHPAVYLVEMGAYRRGEIAALAKLARPRLGIITAIGNQHLATFGSIENISRTKWELIAALPAGGTAVLNADDENVVQLASRHPTTMQKLTTIWYATEKSADVYARNITIRPRSISCHLYFKEYARDIVLPLAGDGALSNAVAAAAAAYALGVTPAEIFSSLSQLKPMPRTLEIVKTGSGTALIDDSYSANEHGVLAALKHLSRFPQNDKRVILVPLIELGPDAAAAHRRIGQALGRTGAQVYVYGIAYRRELTAALPGGRIQFYTSAERLARESTRGMNAQTAALLEGRIPDLVRAAMMR